jgi:hypothetical protein
MGYPEEFKIPVSDTQAYRQFGNSVVVPVVKAVAAEVVQALQRPTNFQPVLVLANEDIEAAQTPEFPKASRQRKSRAKVS